MKERSISTTLKRNNERGSVLAYTVLSALFLFLAVGLSVDLGHLYLAKTELQNSADAAALAGASALTLPISDPATLQPYRIPEAVNRALLMLNQNNYNFNNRNFNLSTSNDQHRQLVRFAVNLSEFDNGGNGRSEAAAIASPNNIRFLRVITPLVPINTFFAIPILGLSKNLDARAVSGMSVPGNLSVCIAPLSAVSCSPGSSTCSLCDPGDPDYPDCTWSKYWGNCGGANPHDELTVVENGPDDPDGNGKCDPKKEFCQGCSYNIRSEGQNQQGPQAGNFQILACAGSGANAARNALAAYGTNCECGRLSSGDEVTTEPGVAAGAVRDGLNVRFDLYSSENGNFNYDVTRPPDVNIAQGSCIANCNGQSGNATYDGISYDQYLGTTTPKIAPVPPATGHVGKADRRVLLIPIIPMTEFTNSQGRQTVNIASFGGFFMRSQVGGGTGGDIQVEYIGNRIKGVVGFDPNDENTTNFVTPVLYR